MALPPITQSGTQLLSHVNGGSSEKPTWQACGVWPLPGTWFVGAQ